LGASLLHYSSCGRRTDVQYSSSLECQFSVSIHNMSGKSDGGTLLYMKVRKGRALDFGPTTLAREGFTKSWPISRL